MKKILIKIIQSNLFTIRIISPILRFFNPKYSFCKKCKLPWNWCELRTVMYSENRGSFATCKHCWNNSTLDQLKEYHTQTYIIQQNQCMVEPVSEMDHTLEHMLNCVERDYKNHQSNLD